ncbi:MAG: hypothetical protein QOC60_124 [Frankiaceae bacterium]|nr:hypothetical protein [Frankiaceae bacterium]
MDMPIDQAGSLLQAATHARRQARTDRACAWIPMGVFGAFMLLSTPLYVDWRQTFGPANSAANAGVGRWLGAFSTLPALYWVLATFAAAAVSDRLIRSREARLGLRLGTVVPTLVGVLAVLALVRSLGFPIFRLELVAVCVGLLVIAVRNKEIRAIASLTVCVALACVAALYNTENLLPFAIWEHVNAYSEALEVVALSAALGVSAWVSRPRSRLVQESGHAPRA